MNPKTRLLPLLIIGLFALLFVGLNSTGLTSPGSALAAPNAPNVAGITVNPTSGLVTTETGGQATFTVVLDEAPTSDVTIGLSSSDTTEGIVSPASLTFTTANWNTTQTVTITGVDDLVVDGNVAYTIVTAPASSTDLTYDTMNASDVSVTNNDNDVAGITVTPTSGLTTTEAGGQATFTVNLNSQPTADVTIGLSSSDTTEGTVSPASLTFTSANWNSTQTVTITGVDDFVVDGNVPYTIITAPASSTDLTYNTMNASDVSVTNNDNDVAGITVTPTSGLTTTEAGGQATFTVNLNSQPTADVTIGLSSSDTTEGTVSPASLTFTSANWNSTQTVTVTGVDDFLVDGNVPYTIITAPASSTDLTYSTMNASDVSVTNNDNDIAGITVNPTLGLITTESLTQATFTVVLNTQPAADVIIGLSSSDTTEGTVSPASLTFTTGNWNTTQTVTVTGVDDFVVDGNIAYTIITAPASSTDLTYDTMNASNVSVTNNDNDVAGITVTPTSGLTTTEAGVQATFTVKLNSQPTADVTIGLSSSDTTEGTVSPASLTFTTSNWNTTQTVTVTGVDDFVVDGNVAYTIITAPASSTDLTYNTMNASDVSVTNNDNDTAGITAHPTVGDSLLTTEFGATATFTVTLDTQPSGSVTIALSSSDTSEGTVFPTSVTFTSSTWDTPQTVTVTGVDDVFIDGSIDYTINLTVSSSGDPNYIGATASVPATNADNDVAGLAVSPTSGVKTSEGGQTKKINVLLNTPPGNSVIINIVSDDLTEGTVSAFDRDTNQCVAASPPIQLTFNAATWNLPQVICVTGVDDTIADGDVVYNVTFSASSNDSAYNGKQSNVPITNQDAPTIEWVLPSGDEQIYYFTSDSTPITLKVQSVGSEPIESVYFYRWDHVLLTQVSIATEYAPFEATIDPKSLYFEFNQIFAAAYSPQGVASINVRTLPFRKYVLFMPSVNRDR